MQLNQIRELFRQQRLLSEREVMANVLSGLNISPQDQQNISANAQQFVHALRADTSPGLMESFLAEYGLSTDEGVALMCLAEAYLRTPDDLTMDALIRDKIGTGQWSRHRGGADSPFVNVTTWALMLSGRVFRHKKNQQDDLTDTMFKLVQRLGEPVARVAVSEAMKLMGKQFVLGRDIDEAIANGQSMRGKGYRYSYDMLGEAARTGADAQRYFLAYSKAISAIAQQAKAGFVHDNPGISVKLSALHPRYEYVQHDRVMHELVPRMAALIEQARAANIGLNIDAEEMDRLDLSLDVIEAVLRSPSLAGWDGFGVVVQAYSKQALPLLDWLHQLALDLDRKISVRLVKGAYWDSEIKNAQVLGLDRYPVFTQKQSTDVSYLACAQRLLDYSERIYPQFATHNAHTVSAILAMASAEQAFEFQRLHGMGEALHELVRQHSARVCRIYAPVGIHKDLLAYLVRRLLENGANSSFVNQVLDQEVAVEQVVSDPIQAVQSFEQIRNAKIPLPKQLFGECRVNSKGYNLNDPLDSQQLDMAMQSMRNRQWQAAPMIKNHQSSAAAESIFSPVDGRDLVGQVKNSTPEDVEIAIQLASEACVQWAQKPAIQRAQILEKTADLFEQNTAELIALACREAGKTRLDGVLEVREAVDFLRYYAAQIKDELAKHSCKPLGVVACISPWNFPLAIFTGQVTAALAGANSVLAKPAEQTPLIAAFAVGLFHQGGVPEDVLQLLPGDGAIVGAALTSSPVIKGVCFTGSTQTAIAIDRSMAEKGDSKAPLIAETGGLNAMIVDSSALPEQAVRDIVQSAFQSAGQRCSALRLLVVQEDIAEDLLVMLEGAANELVIGDGWDCATDVGPVIDGEAQTMILDHMRQLDDQGRCLFKTRLPDASSHGTFVPAACYKLDRIADLTKEVFGPILHVVTFKAKDLDATIEQINASGYGLTLGAHSRVDERMNRICAAAKVGNIYLNRNQIGAVVGVQPFGGEGLSGTGPKAGGPEYIYRFCHNESQPMDGSVDLNSIAPAVDFKRLEKLDPTYQTAISQAIARAYSVARAPRVLNGPTGERNTYSLHPRGVVLCTAGDHDAANNDSEQALICQVILALAAGNKVIVSTKTISDNVRQHLQQIRQAFDMESEFLVFLDQTVLEICQDEAIDMVVCDFQDVTEVRRALAARSGARIVLIRSSDRAQLYYQERVVSEDTTASGGNAKLLAGLG